MQEAENKPLLFELAETLAGTCPFTYEVTHLDSVDVRGIDVALLTDPRRVIVKRFQLRQGCSIIETGIRDPGADCEPGSSPLFSRPPLQVDVSIDDLDFTLFVNYFKSKRGGANETAPRRMAQAEHINGLVTELLASKPTARIVVMGDFNNDEMSPTLLRMTSAGGQLSNPMLSIPRLDRYSFIFDGISQLIDGILISLSLRDAVNEAAIVHVNADYPYVLAHDPDPEMLPYRASDLDPLLLVLSLTRAVEHANVVRGLSAAPPISAAVPGASASRAGIASTQPEPIQPQETAGSIQEAELAGLAVVLLLLLGFGIAWYRRVA